MESHRAAELALRNRDASALQAAIIRDISDAASDLGRTLRDYGPAKTAGKA